MKKLDIPGMVITAMASVSIIIIFFIFLFIFSKAYPVLKESGISLLTTSGFDTQITEAFFSSEEEPVYTFGMLGLILGTIMSTGVALVLATFIGVGASITICEFTNKKLSIVFTNITRLLAAIPSVVFGLIGIITIVPLVEKLFITTDMVIENLEYFQMTGKNLLSATIVLTFMIVPTIISLSTDAINAVPNHYKETGYAFGMSHFRVIWKIILPTARSGILSSIILGAGRGIGEAIAVSMVCGAIGFIPMAKLGFLNLLAPTLPLASAIVNKSEAMGSAPVESALFAAAAILLILGLLLSLGAKYIEKRLRRAAGYEK